MLLQFNQLPQTVLCTSDAIWHQLQSHVVLSAGGLAVDYEGSGTDSTASLNYSMQSYANDIVAALQVCTTVPVACVAPPNAALWP